MLIPRHLSPRSKRLYRQLAEDYALEDELHAMEVLRLAFEALDRCEQARAALAVHGTTYLDRWNAPRARPEVALERDSRLAAARLFRELSLDAEPSEGPRVPRARS